MFFPLLRFEIGFRLRQASTYIFFGILFLLGFLFMATDAVKIGGGSGRTLFNSPYVILLATTILMILGTIIVSALMGTAIYRDFESNVHELFFTTRLTRRDYLMGRFVGSYLVTAVVFSGILFGLAMGSVMPWVDHSKMGPTQLSTYLYVFGVTLLPDLLLTGALFFVFGALTRSLMAIYVQGVVLLVGYLMASSLLSTIENRTVASLLDPFGLAAVRVVTRYWTVDERNTHLIPLVGPFLWNRLLWTGIGLGVFAVGYRLFSFRARLEGRRQRVAGTPVADIPPPASRPAIAGGAPLQPASPRVQYLQFTRFYLRDTLRGVAFLVISLLGIALFVIAALQSDRLLARRCTPLPASWRRRSARISRCST